MSSPAPIPSQTLADPLVTGSRTPARSVASGKSGVPKIIAFFCLVGVLAMCLHLLIGKGLRDIKTSKFGAMNRVVEGRGQTDVIINGSSRALCHYDPRIIKSITGLRAYNLGMNASQIDFQLAILRTYLKHHQKPRVVVQNLDLFSFETTKKGAIYDPGYLIPYLSEPEIYGALRKIDPEVWKWKHIPLYGYTVEDMRFTWIWGLFGIAGFSGPEDYFDGFNPRPGNWNEDFESFRAAASEGITYPVEPEGIAALQSIISLCASEGIPLILVFSPEYVEMQRLEKNRPEIIARFESMAKDAGISFWDYSSSHLSSSTDFFNNSQHLNAHGAAEFSKDLAQKLATAGFAQQP